MGVHDIHLVEFRIMSITLDIVSVGKACSILQVHPQRIREAAETLNITPSARINEISYYDAAALERIGEYLSQIQKQKH